MNSSDIAAASSVSQAQLGFEVGVAVAKKSLDAAKQEGAAVLSLLQQAVELQQAAPAGPVNGVGEKLDVRG